MHDRVCVNAVCFMGSSFSELAEIWQTLAPRRVGLVSKQLMDEGVAAARAALATGDYKVETISHQFHIGHLEPGEETWSDARMRLSRVIKDAKTLDASSISMVTGGHGDLTWKEAAECFAAAIAPCVREAKAASIALLIEPSPSVYAHSNLNHSLRDTLTCAEMAGIGVCIDVFACWSEGGLLEMIERSIPRCHNIQVGDYIYGDQRFPCRAVVGDGAIPIQRLCSWALNAGYTGPFDLELLGSRIDQEGRVSAVSRSARTLSEILYELGA